MIVCHGISPSRFEYVCAFSRTRPMPAMSNCNCKEDPKAVQKPQQSVVPLVMYRSQWQKLVTYHECLILGRGALCT